MAIEGEKNSKTAEKIAKNAMELGIKAIDSNNFAESLEYVNHIHHGKIDDINIFKKILRKFVYNRVPKARILICGSLYFAGKFISENDEK
jgi:folylpolyglutamate synthase/dihydropteroate synthase